jgi:hypothetical protein
MHGWFGDQKKQERLQRPVGGALSDGRIQPSAAARLDRGIKTPSQAI